MDHLLDRPVERLQLDEGSWIDIGRGWLAPDEAGPLFSSLLDGVSWQTSQLFRYDHMVEENRLGSFWRPGRPLPDPLLGGVHRALQRRYHVQFEGFGIMQYRNGRDGQAFHRDTDMRWLDETVIAIVSLGARRPWLLRPRTSRYDHNPGRGATHDLAPGPGDLLVMGGRCQAEWEHSVPYQLRSTLTPRISLQWRWTSRRGRPFQGASYRAALSYSRPR